MIVKEIELQFGAASTSARLKLPPSTITVFVGPNNSGKSLVLAELRRYFTTGVKHANDKILESVEISGYGETEARRRFELVIQKPKMNESIPAGQVPVGARGTRILVNAEDTISVLTNPQGRLRDFAQRYLAYNTLFLDGSTRMQLLNQQPAGDLQEEGTSSFQVLFRDDAKREELRRVVGEATGLYPVLDPTHLGQLRMRLSKVPPSTPEKERGIDQTAVDFHSNAMRVEQGSDGVRAFAGIVTEVVAGDPSIMLIDEPEAFLHPALAFKLGEEVAQSSAGANKQLIVSTHSPQFVMGCIQSGAKVNIVRLTHRREQSTARLLPGEDLVRLMRNPLLRSTGLLSGLFYEFVVVTESDADRAFYQEVNERLVAESPERGIPNCLFLNAQNKQTIQQLVEPLRSLGIPAAAIVDIDVVKEGGRQWTGLLASASVPEPLHQPLGIQRATVKSFFEVAQIDMKRDGGLSRLAGDQRATADDLFDKLSDYGVFVVRNGELESWLGYLGATGHGPRWLIEVFEKMGEDPRASDYLHPAQGDVWDFLSEVGSWLRDGGRKGIPE